MGFLLELRNVHDLTSNTKMLFSNQNMWQKRLFFFSSNEDDEDFHSTVSESASKVVVHSRKMAKILLRDGQVYGVYKIIGGLALVRNKLWHYNEYIKVIWM